MIIHNSKYAAMDYLTEKEAETLLNACQDNTKHRLIILVMVDCGLRVSETINIKIKDFDFKKRILHVRSLKKRDKELIRQIPISNRLYNLLADYIYSQNRLKPDDWLFPTPGNPYTHITRFAVFLMLRRRGHKFANGLKVHPHALRHTFATRHIANDTPIHEIKTMLGHSRLDTTLIYTHIPSEKLRGRIERVNNEKLNFLQRTMRRLGFKKPQKQINISFRTNQITIGRNDELEQLFANGNKGINTVIIGNIGVGKSHLITAFKENFKEQAENGRTDKKLLYFDDLDNIKETLAQTLLFLYKGDKQAVYNLLFDGLDYSAALQKITRESVVNLALQLVKITNPKEYILLIDDLTKVTPKVVTILEKLKDHFTIITSAREVPIKKSSFLWNFEIIKLQPLNRVSSLQLIYKLSSNINTNDTAILQNHIYDQTNGNPRAITEMVQRYEKENFVNSNNIRQITHHGALKELDLTFSIILFLACMAVMRYFASGLQNPNLRIIGGIGLIALFIGRYFFQQSKRKFI